MTIPDRWKRIQAKVGAVADGEPNGPDTVAHLEKALGIPSPVVDAKPPLLVTEDGLVDERSEKNIATLLPVVRVVARTLVRRAAEQGITIKVISGTRTYEEQDALYAQGRSKPGSIVTKARAGYSNHNFGIAFDIGVFKGTAYLPESPLYKTVGSIGKSLGLDWGGDWTSISDEPHFQLRPSWAKGMSESAMLAELRKRKANNQPVFS